MGERLPERPSWRKGIMVAAAVGTAALIHSGESANNTEVQPHHETSLAAGSFKALGSITFDGLSTRQLGASVEPPPVDIPIVPTTAPTPSTTIPDRLTANRSESPRASRGGRRTTTTSTPSTSSTTTVQRSSTISGTKAEWMAAAGIPQSDWGYVDSIMTPESHWNPADNSGRCIGLGQNCADNDGQHWLADACPAWQRDPVCQLQRFARYALERYGGWAQAASFRRSHNWW